MRIRSLKIAAHIEKVKKRNEEHHEEILKSQMGTFEKSMEKVKKMQENSEYRERQMKQLIDQKRMKMDQRTGKLYSLIYRQR